jgi:hypothetical protein
MYNQILEILAAALKLLPAINIKREKAPVSPAVVPAALAPVAVPSSTLTFDSRDAAIFCLYVALIFVALSNIFLAARR